ncbi:MAG: helix-turn-helix domain-containing protein [Eubacteriales bacterium]
MNNTNSENRWVSMTEICNHLGISRDTAIKWINKKEMPANKIGRLWKFKVDEVDNWVRSGGAEEKEYNI